MKKILATLIIVFSCIEMQSQITFERTYSGWYLWSTIQLGDGGYLYTGSNDTDKLVIGRLNKYGKPVWLKTFGGDGYNTGRYMIRTKDNNFVVAGQYQNNYEYSIYVIKFDSLGTIKFEKKYRGDYDVRSYAIAELNDGNFLVTGNVDETYFSELKLFKIGKTAGDSIWCKTYTRCNGVFMREVKKTNDNNFMIVGERNDNIYLFKTNDNGDSLWANEYNIPYVYYGFGLVQTKDNGFILGGQGSVIKTKADGTVDWIKDQSDWGFGSYYSVFFRKIIPTMDGNYMATGCWDPDYPWAFLMKFNANGDSLMRTLYYNNTTWTDGTFVQQTKDSGYIISCFQYDTTADYYSYFDFIKTDKNGEIYSVDTPKICLVTSDLATEKNRIVWERQNTKGIEYYIINRKEGLSWKSIANRPYDSLSVYVDATSSPKNFHYQYCITARNYNDDTTARSPFIETALLQSNTGTSGTANLSWNPYLDESGKFIPAYYYIYSGPTKSSISLLDSISGDTKNPSYNDTKFNGKTTYYQIRFKKDKICEPAKILKSESGPYSQSLSNIVEYKVVGENITNMIGASVFPNPVTDHFNVTFELSSNENVQLEIADELGRVMCKKYFADCTAGINTIELNASDCRLTQGTNYIKIITTKGISILKFDYLK